MLWHILRYNSRSCMPRYVLSAGMTSIKFLLEYEQLIKRCHLTCYRCISYNCVNYQIAFICILLYIEWNFMWKWQRYTFQFSSEAFADFWLIFMSWWIFLIIFHFNLYIELVPFKAEVTIHFFLESLSIRVWSTFR